MHKVSLLLCNLLCSKITLQFLSYFLLDGPCLVHTTHGDLLRSLEPPEKYKCPNIISFAREGYIIVNYDGGNMATYSVNGKLLRHVEHNDNVQVS
jgi:hypothetical protein